MTHPTRDAQLTPVMYTQAELERIQLEERCAHYGKDVANEALARCRYDRIEALAWVKFHFVDRSFGDVVEDMVRESALQVLLCYCMPAEKTLWREILEEGWADSVAAVRAHCSARRGSIEKGIREGQREGLRA